MVSRGDLKQAIVFGYLSDDMLDKLIPITDKLKFKEQEIIFREGDTGDQFYILKRGKVLLEKNISDKVSISSGAIKPGYSFGWSAMLGGQNYTLDAICAEQCEVFSFKGENIRKLLDEDHSMGYLMMQGFLKVVNRRLNTQTEQFMRVVTKLPDIGELIEDEY